MPQITVRMKPFARATAVCLFLLVFAASAWAAPRVVAIGDVHGDYDAFVSLLQREGLVDAGAHWNGGNATLVQVGDFMDRGPKVRAVIELLMSLQREAPRTGGRVVVVLGNHEVMNIMGDLRYDTAFDWTSFADDKSEARRAKAWQEYERWGKNIAGKNGIKSALTREEWMQRTPAGYLEQREAMGPNGKYGRWLRSLPAVARVGDILFLHGGISPENARFGLDETNNRVKNELEAFDHCHKHLAQNSLSPEYPTLEEFAQTLNYATRAWGTMEDRDVFQPCAAYTRWLSFHPTGPLWYRGYSEWTEEEGPQKIEPVLSAFKVQRVVVGHTPSSDGRIVVRFGGKVMLIDTGMLNSYYPFGRPSALEIADSTFTAVYPDSRVVLLHPPQPIAWVEREVPGGGVPPQQAPAIPAMAPLQRTWLGADGNPLPFKTDEEVLAFLAEAKIVEQKSTGKGINQPIKLTLEKDGVRAHAVFRDVDVDKVSEQMAGGGTELFFRDSYIFEPAAYIMARMLNLNFVPPAVLRELNGKPGSVQIWLENALVEVDKQKKKLQPPNPEGYAKQVHRMRIFDQLIFNFDRNAGNILYDQYWTMWMIDHTRSFRRLDVLLDKKKIERCDRELYERMKALNPDEVRARFGPYLRKGEIDALLKRRDLVIKAIDELIAKKGEGGVLYDTVASDLVVPLAQK